MDNFTIDQVYLMYEKSVKEKLDDRKMDAITLANAGTYTTPSYSKESARKKQRMWQRFMDSLDWNKLLQKKKDHSPEDIKKAFKSIGVISIAGGKKKKKGVDK